MLLVSLLPLFIIAAALALTPPLFGFVFSMPKEEPEAATAAAAAAAVIPDTPDEAAARAPGTTPEVAPGPVKVDDDEEDILAEAEAPPIAKFSMSDDLEKAKCA